MGIFLWARYPFRAVWALPQAFAQGTNKLDVLLYKGTSLKRTPPPLGPCSRNMPRVLWWSYGGKLFLMSEVPLYPFHVAAPVQSPRYSSSGE